MAETKSQGSDIVLRGLMLLALMVIVVIGGFAMFFRRPTQAEPVVALEPERLAAMLVHPTAAFPAAVSWGPLIAFVGELPSKPGWRIRYQAARNLAHRGNPKVSWPVYRELLDEQQQFRNFRVRLDDGRFVTEEAAARQIIIGALKDLTTWHGKQPKSSTAAADLLEVYVAVDKLAQSPFLELSSQAEKARAVFFARSQ